MIGVVVANILGRLFLVKARKETINRSHGAGGECPILTEIGYR